jgi:hypothetical protein
MYAAGLLLLLTLAGMQFVPVEQTNPPVLSDLFAPADVAEILRRACYDCHSHETRWPWYSRVAPISWWVVSHVEDGRDDLNFSEWPVFDFEAQAHAMDDIWQQVSKGEMPLRNYTFVHRDAILSEADRARLLDWADPGP